MSDTASIRKVFQYSNKLINPTDASNYLAGGYMRNESIAGGAFYSPTAINKLNEASSLDKNFKLIDGNILSYLNYGFGDIKKQMISYENIGNTLNSEIKTTEVISVRFQLTSVNSNISLYDNTIEVNLDDGENVTPDQIDSYNNFSSSMSSGNISGATNNTSILDVADAWDNQLDLTQLANMGPIDMAVYAYNVYTDESTTLQTRLEGAVIGTVKNQLTNAIVGTVAKIIGITQVTVGVIIGAKILGAVINEFFEMAIGLDNQFGFGGSFNTSISILSGVPAYNMYEGFMGLTTMREQLAYKLHLRDTWGYDIGTKAGSLLGTYAEGRMTGENGTTIEVKEYYSYETGENIDIDKSSSMSGSFNDIKEQADEDAKGMLKDLDDDGDGEENDGWGDAPTSDEDETEFGDFDFA